MRGSRREGAGRTSHLISKGGQGGYAWEVQVEVAPSKRTQEV